MTAGRIRVPVPAETGGEDRLVGSLTFRHAAYLAVAAAGLAVMLLGHVSTARLCLGALLAIIGVAGAMLRPYGEPLDRLAFTAIAYLIHRRATPIDDEPVKATEDVKPVEAEQAPAAPPEPAESTDRRSRVTPVAVRRLLAAIAVCGIGAIVATRLMDRPPPPSPPAPHVVVVPVPITPPDPWGEVDRDFDEWLNSFG